MKSFFLKIALITVVIALLFTSCTSSGSSSNLLQFTDLSSHKPQAIIKTSMGDITVALFDKEAPKAVENFIGLSESDYYNGLIIHRVIDNFMIQGGSPNGDGLGGDSIFGEDFEDEFSDNLKNFNGALSMANSGKNTNSSQFFIVQAGPMATKEEFEEGAKNNNMTYDEFINAFYKENFGITDENLIKKYAEVGGTPHLDNVHTVFGQVISGMDIVDKIAKLEKNPDDRPLVDVTIDEIIVSK